MRLTLFSFSGQDHSIPLIPYTSAQEQALQDNAFMGLLLSIGIHLPEDSGNVFPRIPHFWNVEDLFTKAEKLAPIKVGELLVKSCNCCEGFVLLFDCTCKLPYEFSPFNFYTLA